MLHVETVPMLDFLHLIILKN